MGDSAGRRAIPLPQKSEGCEGYDDHDIRQLKYHKDIQQTVVQYLSVKKQMYVESLKIMMEGERVINFIAK